MHRSVCKTATSKHAHEHLSPHLLPALTRWHMKGISICDKFQTYLNTCLISVQSAKQGLLLSAVAEEALFHLHHRQDLYPLWHSHSAPHTGWCQMVWQSLMWVGHWLVIWRWQMLYCAPVPDITLLPRLQPLFSCHHCVHYRCQSNY